jgi:uncharacterized OB-fold protein
MSKGKIGKLLSFTVLQTVPEGFEAPLIIGMVDLPDGTKLLCNGKCQEQDLKIGLEVIINQKDKNYTFEMKG